VEEKLLIGDRPKQTAGFDKKLSLRDRLLQQNPEDLTNVRTILKLMSGLLLILISSPLMKPNSLNTPVRWPTG